VLYNLQQLFQLDYPIDILSSKMTAPSVPIAIIGMSCRFAGGATDPEKLWDLVAEARTGWSEIPEDRFNIDGHYHPRPDNLNTTNVKGACFLDEDVGNFDATFFNLPAETAAVRIDSNANEGFSTDE
jgi:acyl transferase domain-containing protein